MKLQERFQVGLEEDDFVSRMGAAGIGGVDVHVQTEVDGAEALGGPDGRWLQGVHPRRPVAGADGYVDGWSAQVQASDHALLIRVQIGQEVSEG